MESIYLPDVVSFAPYALAKKPDPSSDDSKAPVWVSGMVPADEDGEIVAPGSVEEQMERALKNFRLVLEEAGGDLSDVVKINIYVTDIREYLETGTNEKLLDNFDEPAETLVEVNNLASEGQVIEFDGVALVDK